MRKIIDFNRKWVFTKMADAVPKTMPTKWHFDCLHLNSLVKSSTFQIEVIDTVLLAIS